MSSKLRHVIVYGQRSVDDRIVFGGRGAPCHFGSGIKAGFDSDARVFRTLRRRLRRRRVALTNLAGRTLADLVTTRDTALTRLPWGQHRSRQWEPEPLRWLGVNAGLQLANLDDRQERLTGRPTLLVRALSAPTSHYP